MKCQLCGANEFAPRRPAVREINGVRICKTCFIGEGPYG